jgi:hypothetical protein
MKSPSIMGRNLHVPRLSGKMQGIRDHTYQQASIVRGKEKQKEKDSLTALTMAPTEADRRHPTTSSASEQPI